MEFEEPATTQWTVTHAVTSMLTTVGQMAAHSYSHKFRMQNKNSGLNSQTLACRLSATAERTSSASVQRSFFCGPVIAITSWVPVVVKLYSCAAYTTHTSVPLTNDCISLKMGQSFGSLESEFVTKLLACFWTAILKINCIMNAEANGIWPTQSAYSSAWVI